MKKRPASRRFTLAGGFCLQPLLRAAKTVAPNRMPLNEAETRYHLIDPALRDKGYRMPWIKLEAEASALDRAARESQAKAAAIEAAVYDLKAVNPNAVVKNDTRTPEEVIQSIEDHGRVVAGALAALRGILQHV